MKKLSPLTLSVIATAALFLFMLNKEYLFHTIFKLPELEYKIEGNGKIATGGFRLWVGKHQCATTGVSYVLPVDENGTPCPKGIIFYGPFLGENAAEFGIISRWLYPLAEKYGYLVFSIATHNTPDDRIRPDYYTLPESGWDKIVFRIAEHFRKEFGIPDGPLKMTGESGGACMVQQLHAIYPDKISAVAWIGGDCYPKNYKEGTGRILGVTIWGDDGEQATDDIATYATMKGYEAYSVGAPPTIDPTKGAMNHHSGWKIPYDMIVDFLAGNPDWRKNNYYDIPKYFMPGETHYLPVPKDSIGKLIIACSDDFLDAHTPELRLLMWEAYFKKLTVVLEAAIPGKIQPLQEDDELPVFLLTDYEDIKVPDGIARLDDEDSSTWRKTVMFTFDPTYD